MTVYQSKSIKVITVQQFAESFFPVLIQSLTQEAGITLREAVQVGERIIQKLKDRFNPNKPQPVQVFQQAIAIIVDRETKNYKRLIENNFGLSESDFQEMVVKLQAGDEQLYERVFLHHFTPCVQLLKKKYRASHQDAYDATMNAMLLFCRKLKEDRIEYGNLRHLFTQIAEHRYLKWIKRESKTLELNTWGLVEELPQYVKEGYDILGRAFAKLGEGCRDLLNAFYHQENTLQQVAARTNRSYAAIRKQKQRCIEKLRTYFSQLS